MRAHLLRFTIPLVAASLAQAQSNPPPIIQWPFIRFDYIDQAPWPTGESAPTAFRRALGGDFDGNGLRDAIVLEQEATGGKVVFYPQPCSWPFQVTAWEAGGPFANDVDVIPGSAGQASLAAIVGPNGLDRLIYAPDNSIPVNGGRMGSYFAWAPISHDALWQGAKLVRAGQLDAGGSELDYVGVKDAVNPSTQALESTVVIRQTIGGNTTTLSFTLPGVVVHDAFIGQWNDTPDNEIFLLNSSGVEIYSPAGVRVRRFVRPYADDGSDVFCGFKRNMLVNGQEVPEGKLHVAWFRRKVVGQVESQELVELNAPAVTVSSGIGFPTNDYVVSVTAGDSPVLDGSAAVYLPADGNQDLALRCASNCAVKILKNLGPAGSSAPASFAASMFQVVGDGSQAGLTLNTLEGTSTMAAPLYEDLSGDGVADLFVPVLSPDGASGPTITHMIYEGNDQAPTAYVEGPLALIVMNPDLLLDRADKNSVNDHDYASSLNTGLDVLLNLQELAPPAGAQAIEIFCWQRDKTNGAYTELYPGHGYYNYTPPQTITANTRMVLRLPVISYPAEDQNNFSSDWPNQYLFEVRFAYWSGSSLVPLGTNHILMIGENKPDTLLYYTDGFSDVECVGGLPETDSLQVPSDQYDCREGGFFEFGTQPVHSPVSFTRRRLPPRPNGAPALLPLPSEPVHLQTQSTSTVYTYDIV